MGSKLFVNKRWLVTHISATCNLQPPAAGHSWGRVSDFDVKTHLLKSVSVTCTSNKPEHNLE